MEAALKAISDRTRREILCLVWRSELPAGEIASHFSVTRPAVSQHLKVLKDASLVSERRSGVRRLYRARPEGLTEVRAFLEQFWDGRLDALKAAAEAEERSRGNQENPIGDPAPVRRSPKVRRARGRNIRPDNRRTGSQDRRKA